MDSTTSTAARTPLDRRLFGLAVGLIGLHVADDNFLQPEAGTSASDHLLSGLLPLALLALAYWAYPPTRTSPSRPATASS